MTFQKYMPGFELSLTKIPKQSNGCVLKWSFGSSKLWSCVFAKWIKYWSCEGKRLHQKHQNGGKQDLSYDHAMAVGGKWAGLCISVTAYFLGKNRTTGTKHQVRNSSGGRNALLWTCKSECAEAFIEVLCLLYTYRLYFFIHILLLLIWVT